MSKRMKLVLILELVVVMEEIRSRGASKLGGVRLSAGSAAPSFPTDSIIRLID